jgi:hypothetical protein
MNRPLAALALAGSLALVPTARATTARAIPFEEKVDKAEAIVPGKCVNTRAQWDAGHRWILTYSTFAVEQTMKGNAPAELTLVTPGGEADGVHQDTIGIPAFAPGDERVLFVKNTSVGPTVLYFDQGAYEVSREGREPVVRPVASAAVRVDTQTGNAVEAEGPRTLRQFAGQVRETATRMQAQKMELIRGRERQAAASPLPGKYKILIALALAGLAAATWQLLRR